MEISTQELKSKSNEELIKIVKQLQRKCKHQESEILDIQESFKETSNQFIEKIKDLEANTEKADVLTLQLDEKCETQQYHNPFRKYAINQDNSQINQTTNTNSSLADQSTRPQTAVIFNDIIKSNSHDGSVEKHLQILNRIRGSGVSKMAPKLDIFNGFERDDSDEDEEPEEFTITEEDLRIEFQKSKAQDHTVQNTTTIQEALHFNINPNPTCSLKDMKQTNRTLCPQCGAQVDNALQALKTHMLQCTQQFKYCKKCEDYYKYDANYNHHTQQKDILAAKQSIKESNPKELEKFLKHNLDTSVEILHNGRKMKLIHQCVVENSDSCLKVLLQQNGSANEPDLASRNVAYQAAEQNRYQILEDVQQDLSDEELVGMANNGLNAVHIAVKKANIEAFNVLANRLSINDLEIMTGMKEDLQCVARQSGSITMQDIIFSLGLK